MTKGIDCATPLTLEVAKKIKAAGYQFVCRYSVSNKYKKYLSPEEAKIISDAGLDILSVYETNAGYMKMGMAQAGLDAPTVKQCLANLKQPKGSAVYFTADFDVTKQSDFDAIERYLRQMTYLFPDYEIGLYGEHDIVEEMARRKACEHFWQTYAWSGKQKSQCANVYQYQNGVDLAGIKVDLNESYGNEGFWSYRPAGPFTDVAADRWSADAIKCVKDAGVMGGYPDGEFKPGQTVTREELAVVVARIIKK